MSIDLIEPARDRLHNSISSIEEIIETARNGLPYILVDAEDRENEGDVIIPAQFATPAQINFMAEAGGPNRNRGCLYSESRDMLLHSGELDRDAKAAIFGGTVKRVLGWQPLV